jgi:hypothetical protein
MNPAQMGEHLLKNKKFNVLSDMMVWDNDSSHLVLCSLPIDWVSFEVLSKSQG